MFAAAARRGEIGAGSDQGGSLQLPRIGSLRWLAPPTKRL
jgi:hypothetical protein